VELRSRSLGVDTDSAFLMYEPFSLLSRGPFCWSGDGSLGRAHILEKKKVSDNDLVWVGIPMGRSCEMGTELIHRALEVARK
jgi:hypothetical protein